MNVLVKVNVCEWVCVNGCFLVFVSALNVKKKRKKGVEKEREGFDGLSVMRIKKKQMKKKKRTVERYTPRDQPTYDD